MVHTPTSDKTALSTVAPAAGRPCCATCDTRLFFIYKRLRPFLCLIAHGYYFFNTLRQLLSKPSLFSKVAGFRCPRRDAVGLIVHKSLKKQYFTTLPPFSRALSSKSRFRTARQEPTDRWDDVPRSGRFQGVYALASRRRSRRQSAVWNLRPNGLIPRISFLSHLRRSGHWVGAFSTAPQQWRCFSHLHHTSCASVKSSTLQGED